MVELIAIIRRKRAAATKEELARIGCRGYSILPVLGRGKQRGLQTGHGSEGLTMLPKMLLDVVVERAHAQETIEAIVRANQTGEFGDGRIFVIELAAAYRISTGEQASSAREVASQ